MYRIQNALCTCFEGFTFRGCLLEPASHPVPRLLDRGHSLTPRLTAPEPHAPTLCQAGLTNTTGYTFVLCNHGPDGWWLFMVSCLQPPNNTARMQTGGCWRCGGSGGGLSRAVKGPISGPGRGPHPRPAAVPCRRTRPSWPLLLRPGELNSDSVPRWAVCMGFTRVCRVFNSIFPSFQPKLFFLPGSQGTSRLGRSE